MNDYIYKKYEENKGFEQFQAEIYNSVAKKYNAQPFTAESIKKRLHDHKPEQDRNGMTFVFDKGGNPIAYIQYREYAQGKVRIGYPWSKDGTPQEIKDKLFYDLFDYLKAKYPSTKKFYLGFLNSAFTDIIDEIKTHYGFKEDASFSSYSLSLNKVSSLPLPEEYTFKDATKDNIALLTQICLSDKNTSTMGEKRIIDFLQTRFFSLDTKERISFILYKYKEPIGTVLLSKMKDKGKDYSSVRLSAMKKSVENSYEYLLSATGKFLATNGWNDPLSFNFDITEQKTEQIVINLGGDFISKAYEFVYELNNFK